MPSRLSHTSHTSHSNHMSHSRPITATAEQIQALSLLKDETTTNILAYTKHARSLAHGVTQGASHELLSSEQLDAIGTLSSCREDEVRHLLERPYAFRQSAIQVITLHSQSNEANRVLGILLGSTSVWPCSRCYTIYYPAAPCIRFQSRDRLEPTACCLWSPHTNSASAPPPLLLYHLSALLPESLRLEEA